MAVTITPQQKTYRRFKIAALIWFASIALIVVGALASDRLVDSIPKGSAIAMLVLLLMFMVLAACLWSILAFYVYLSRLSRYMGKSPITIPLLTLLFSSFGGPIWAFLYMVNHAQEQRWRIERGVGE